MFSFIPHQARFALQVLIYVFSLNSLFAIRSSAAQNPPIYSSATPSWVLNVAETDQKVNSREISDGYYFTLVDMQEQVEKEAAYTHYCKQIVSETGIQNGSQISVDFDPSFEKLEFHKIIVWRNGKPSNRLNLKAFKLIANEQDLSRFIYQGTYTAYLILDDIRKGDKIEYAYTITGRNPIFKGKYSKEIYLQGYTAINKVHVSILSSTSRVLNFRYLNKVNPPKTQNLNGMKRFEWEALQVKPAVQEESQPAWFNNFNRIQVSDYNSWNEVAVWANDLNPAKTKFAGELASRVVALKKKNAGNPEAYFRDAVTLVQDEVRYMGVEMGMYSHKAHDPEKVFEQRYGDCKDKSLLLISILRSGGIHANMALINTYYKDKVAGFLPSPLNFNHAVVIAYIGNKQVWVDPTISGQGGRGTDIWFPVYRMGLVVSPGNNNLSAIPEVKPGYAEMHETFKIDSATKGASLYVRTRYTGNKAEELRADIASKSIDETEKGYLDWYSKIYKEIEATDTVRIHDDRSKNEVIIEEFYKIGKFLTKEKNKDTYSGNFYAYEIKQMLPKLAVSRKNPVSLNYPYSFSYTAFILLPGGWNVEPEKKEINRNHYKFYYDNFTAGDTLNLNYQYAVTADYLSAADVKQVVKDVEEIENEYLSLSFSYNPQAASAGFRTNYWSVLFAIILTCAVAYAFYRIATLHSFTEMPEYEPEPIGGWLVLLAIGLIGSAIRPLYFVFTQNYFSQNLWEAYDQRETAAIFKTMLVYELGGNLLMSAGAVFCLILMFKKRDIFPKFTMAFLVFTVVFTVSDPIAAYLFLNIDAEADKDTIRAIIGAAVWISYLAYSQRVKDTFVIPYPSEYSDFEEVRVEEKDEKVEDIL